MWSVGTIAPRRSDAEVGGDWGRGQKHFRRTRRGRVLQVVRQPYLRQDVGFGRLVGRADVRDESDLDSVLQEDFASGTRTLLVLDTNVVLHQMDALEMEDCAPLSNAVLCDTVLQEVRKNDLSVYNRLVLLLRNDKRCFLTFPNENHVDTWLEPRAKESPNDHNDRLIREVAKWFKAQIEESGIAKAAFITNDRANKKLAEKEGLRAFTIHEYVDTFKKDFPKIVDVLAAETTRDNNDDGDGIDEDLEGNRVTRRLQKPKFSAHLSLPEINRRLAAGSVHRGTFRASLFSHREGSVFIYSKQDEGQKITIKGFQGINRAVDGDHVAIELIAAPDDLVGAEDDNGDEESTADKELEDVPADDPEKANLLGTEVPPSSPPKTSFIKYGKVVGIIRRNWRRYCGSISEDDAKKTFQSDRVLIVPVETKIPRIRIRTRQLDLIKNKRILVSIDSWDRYSNFPEGHFVKVIGEIGDKETETTVLLHEHDIPTLEFSKKVMRCLPEEGTQWKVTPENSKGREDLRRLPVCSIDPPGCKDIDDALHVRKLENGNIEVGVHIADVTHFVRHDTEIDKEAASRGTSTYLVERRLDMLPGLLTTDICSLKGNADRFAFSVIWEFTPPEDDNEEQDGTSQRRRKKRRVDSNQNTGELEQVSVRFCKSIIHSKAALSYGEAQAWLEDPNARGELPEAVHLLNKIAQILRKRRIEAGALSLASQEVRFKLDNDSHDPTDVEMYQQKEANALVEEFMLLANITVAKRTVERFPRCSMLRRHPSPAKEMFDELIKAARIAGVELNISTSKELADSLDKAQKPGKPFFNKLLRILATRCMMQAVYFISGDYSPNEFRHYGLASEIYTHFTSPIRRYADIVVHRLLAAAEGIDPLPVAYEKKDHMKELCDNLNKRHHMAQLAGRASIALHTVVFFRGNPRDSMAMVSRVRHRGIVVVVPEFGIEGKISFGKSDQDAKANFDFDEDEMQLVHKKTGLKVQIFDEVKVHLRVHRSVTHRETLVISLLQPAIPSV